MIILSCWSHGGTYRLRCRLPVTYIAHNVPFVHNITSLFCYIYLPGVATLSVMHCFSPHHTAASDTVYIIPSHSHSQLACNPPPPPLTHACNLFSLSPLYTTILPYRLQLFFTLCLTVTLYTLLVPFTPGCVNITILLAVFL